MWNEKTAESTKIKSHWMCNGTTAESTKIKLHYA